MRSFFLAVALRAAAAAAAVVAPAAAPAAAQDAPAPLDVAAARSQAELDKSLAELSTLREQIAGEKVPLARQLADLEERLARVRQANEDALRDLDTGSLDQTKSQTDLKLRQDELAYVGNILDEYTRNLEGRLAVGEAPKYAALIAAAKDAPANKDLSAQQRLERQLDVVTASIARLEDAVGGMRFEGSAVDDKGSVTEGTFAAVGPVAVFAASDGHTAGLALAQSGSPYPAVRPLEASLSGAIASLVAAGDGLLPIDPSRGGALKELVQKWSLIDIYKKGGPIMHPLLIVSILALGVVLERVIFIFGEQRKNDRRALQSFFKSVQAGDYPSAIAIGNQSRWYLPKALAYALSHREGALANALVVANSEVMKRFRRGLGVLDTAITIAPLLGLLGTVTGMMNSFSLIGGDLSAPGAITGGIAEALIATAFGLCIAITCLVPYNYLNNRIEGVRHEMEAASAQLELMVEPHKGVVNALGAAHAATHSVA